MFTSNRTIWFSYWGDKGSVRLVLLALRTKAYTLTHLSTVIGWRRCDVFQRELINRSLIPCTASQSVVFLYPHCGTNSHVFCRYIANIIHWLSLVGFPHTRVHHRCCWKYFAISTPSIDINTGFFPTTCKVCDSCHLICVVLQMTHCMTSLSGIFPILCLLR